MDRGLASAAGTQGLAISIGLAVVFVAAGLGVFWSVTARAALLLSVIVGVAIWVLGENFGGAPDRAGHRPQLRAAAGAAGRRVLAAAAAAPRAPVSHDQGNVPVMAQEEMA